LWCVWKYVLIYRKKKKVYRVLLFVFLYHFLNYLIKKILPCSVSDNWNKNRHVIARRNLFYAFVLFCQLKWTNDDEMAFFFTNMVTCQCQKKMSI
jgi:hypothetical protein